MGLDPRPLTKGSGRVGTGVCMGWLYGCWGKNYKLDLTAASGTQCSCGGKKSIAGVLLMGKESQQKANKKKNRKQQQRGRSMYHLPPSACNLPLASPTDRFQPTDKSET